MLILERFDPIQHIQNHTFLLDGDDLWIGDTESERVVKFNVVSETQTGSFDFVDKASSLGATLAFKAMCSQALASTIAGTGQSVQSAGVQRLSDFVPGSRRHSSCFLPRK